MPVNPVLPPYTNFPDANGKPLEAGFIYIGMPGFEARSTPKASFFDVALSIPTGTASGAAIRTMGGFAVRNGSPSMIYVDGGYSITVTDKNGVVVYSALADVDRVGGMGRICTFTTVAGQQTYTLPYDPGLDQCWVTLNGQTLIYGEGYTMAGPVLTLESDLVMQGGSRLAVTGWSYLPSGYVSTWPTFGDYGAVGDNLTDDTVAMNAALAANPTRFVDGEGKTYRVTGVLDGNKICNATLRKDGAGSVFKAWGGGGTPINPTVPFDRGATTLTSATAAAALSVDERFAVIGQNDPYDGLYTGTTGGKTGELVQVKSIVGSVITLKTALYWKYTMSPQIVQVNWRRGVHLRDVVIIGDPAANPGTFDGGGEMIDLRFCLTPILENVFTTGHQMASVMTHCCANLLKTGGGASNLGSEITPGDGLGTGYGLLERGMNVGAVIDGGRYSNLRTSYTTGAGLNGVWAYGVPTSTLVTGCSVTNTKQSGASTHEAGLFQSIVGNSFDICGSMGVNIRSISARVADNFITRTQGPAVTLIDNGASTVARGAVVEGNLCEMTNLGLDLQGNDGTLQGCIEDQTTDAQILNNILRTCGGPAVRLNYTESTVVKGNVITNPCQKFATHGLDYAIGATIAGTGTPFWIVDGNTLIVNDGLCLKAVKKPDGIYVKGAGNVTHGVAQDYSGETLNTNLAFVGRSTVVFGTRDTVENIVSDTINLNAAGVVSGILTVGAQTGVTDDLWTISGGVDGQQLLIRAATGHTITIKNGSGFSTNNIRTGTGADLTLTYTTGGEKYLTLLRDGGLWIKLV